MESKAFIPRKHLGKGLKEERGRSTWRWGQNDKIPRKGKCDREKHKVDKRMGRLHQRGGRNLNLKEALKVFEKW